MHITSLPSRYGIGDMGPAAYEFADFLASAGQRLWQVLPLHPTGYADSPYQCFSAFAGNPLLLSFDHLRDQGLFDSSQLESIPAFPDDRVDYGPVIDFKYALLRRAAQTFFAYSSSTQRSSFDEFCRDAAPWLDDFALFMAYKDTRRENTWATWDVPVCQRDADALVELGARLAFEVQAHKFYQFEFFRQWDRLREHCRQRKVRFMGDVPIYVAHDSADVWAHRELFHIDERGLPTIVAGVPPDYFSATGQLWGNPIYRWDVLAQQGYAWWIERFRSTLKLFDMVRLDHFRGFEAYWEIPAGETTAMNGRWVKGPGDKLLTELQAAIGELPIVAENLGVITPEVERLRHEFRLPGMSLLQFAFGKDPQGPSFRPHNYSRDLVAYTGGHDNDTTVGWWRSSGGADSTRTPEDVRKEKAFARAYLDLQDEADIHWSMIRAVMASVANIAMVPLQDVLGLGTEARMNLPGTTSGNWKWRYRNGALKGEHAEKLRMLSSHYDR